MPHLIWDFPIFSPLKIEGEVSSSILERLKLKTAVIEELCYRASIFESLEWMSKVKMVEGPVKKNSCLISGQ